MSILQDVRRLRELAHDPRNLPVVIWCICAYALVAFAVVAMVSLFAAILLGVR